MRQNDSSAGLCRGCMQHRRENLGRVLGDGALVSVTTTAATILSVVLERPTERVENPLSQRTHELVQNVEKVEDDVQLEEGLSTQGVVRPRHFHLLE